MEQKKARRRMAPQIGYANLIEKFWAQIHERLGMYLANSSFGQPKIARYLAELFLLEIIAVYHLALLLGKRFYLGAKVAAHLGILQALTRRLRAFIGYGFSERRRRRVLGIGGVVERYK